VPLASFAGDTFGGVQTFVYHPRASGGAWGGGQEWTCMTLFSILINYGFLVFGLTDYTGVTFSPHLWRNLFWPPSSGP